MRGFLGRLLTLGIGAVLMTIAGFFSEAPARSQDQEPGQDEVSSSVLGNYLAGRFARAAQDTQEAADFYTRALSGDPDNEVLLEQAFQMETMSGNWPKAIPLAEQLAATHQSHRMSQFLLGVTAFKAGDYAAAEDHFKAASENPIGELTSAIALGWTRLAAGDADGALKAVDLPKQPDWAQFYLRYHRALIADLAGRKAEARASFEKMFRQDSRTLRTSLAYAQSAAHYGDFGLAKAILKEQQDKSQGELHPLARELKVLVDNRQKFPLLSGGDRSHDNNAKSLNWKRSVVDLMKAVNLDSSLSARKQLAKELQYSGEMNDSAKMNAWLYDRVMEKFAREDGGTVVPRDKEASAEAQPEFPFLINSPTEGLAEVFYGLGEALTGEGGVSLGTIYLQLALNAKPDHAFALAALANAQESAKRYEDAIATYDKIPQGTPLQSAIEIRKAFNLNSLDRTDEAKAILEGIVDKDPKDVRPLEALGNILRARKQYADAVTYFTRAIAVLGKSDPRYWGYFYARGTCYERLKNWPAAEADLKRALALAPDQPLVLNYLGYSWVDQGKNLKEGMRLIEKAVQLKPDDGYIVDSLGWAHFKQGNFKEAVRFLERAVEIKPEDPTLNDHLGDAFWKVGREREARFQWNQALSLEPEPEDVDKIKAKIERGLDAKGEAKNDEKTRQVQRLDSTRQRSENKAGPQGRAVE